MLVTGYDNICMRLRVVKIDVTTAHALRAGTLTWTHRDPFDRMLAAQALMEDLTLVSTDPAFSDFPGLRLIW